MTWDGVERRKATEEKPKDPPKESDRPDPDKPEREKFRQTTSERMDRIESTVKEQGGILSSMKSSLDDLANLFKTSEGDSSHTDEQSRQRSEPEPLSPPEPPTPAEKKEAKQDARPKVRGFL